MKAQLCRQAACRAACPLVAHPARQHLRAGGLCTCARGGAGNGSGCVSVGAEGATVPRAAVLWENGVDAGTSGDGSPGRLAEQKARLRTPCVVVPFL